MPDTIRYVFPCSSILGKKKFGVREEILLFEAKNRLDRQVQVKCRLTVSPTNPHFKITSGAEGYCQKSYIRID
jgi:hypothetical protein